MQNQKLPNYYEVLGVSPEASQEDIKKTFKVLILKYHPDRTQHLPDNERKAAEEKTKELTRAYNVLSDENRRAEYDRALSGNPSGFFDILEEFINNPNNPFSEFFRPMRSLIVHGSIGLTLTEIIHGAKKKSVDVIQVISTTKGRTPGKKITIEVDIPPGYWKGMILPVEKTINEVPHTFNIQVGLIEPSEDCQIRADGTVITPLEISYPLAVLGGELSIKLLDDTRKIITIPPGTAPGKPLIIEGQGLPSSPTNPRSPLVFFIQIIVPTKLSKKERGLLEKLKKSFEQKLN